MEALPAPGPVRFVRLPLHLTQREILGLLPPRPCHRRRPKLHRRSHFGKDRFVRNDFATLALRVCVTSLTPRAADQAERRSTRKQTVNGIRWGELKACFRPCADTSTSRALHSSWTEASRGDRTSPNHVIIQRIHKCNNIFESC